MLYISMFQLIFYWRYSNEVWSTIKAAGTNCWDYTAVTAGVTEHHFLSMIEREPIFYIGKFGRVVQATDDAM